MNLLLQKQTLHLPFHIIFDIFGRWGTINFDKWGGRQKKRWSTEFIAVQAGSDRPWRTEEKERGERDPLLLLPPPSPGLSIALGRSKWTVNEMVIGCLIYEWSLNVCSLTGVFPQFLIKQGSFSKPAIVSCLRRPTCITYMTQYT